MAETKLNDNQMNLEIGGPSSLVEVVAGLDKQKQILAQALTQKGIEVSSTDSLDTMAAKVKEMDVVGATDKVVCEFHNQFNKDTATLASKIGAAFARIIYSRNAIVSKTAAGVFGIYKLADDGTLVEIASCDCSDFVTSNSGTQYQIWGFSKNGEYIAWFDSKIKKLILFRMDWETNTLTRVLAYTTTTPDLGSSGTSYSHTYGSYSLLYGLVSAEDGSKVCILSSNKNYYVHATVVDVATQTETTNIGTNSKAYYWSNNEYIVCGTYHWDTTTGIIQGSTARRPLFQFHLDLTEDVPLLEFAGDRISNSGSYSADYYGAPLFLWEKGLMLQIASNNKTAISTGTVQKGTLYLKDISTGLLLDSVDVGSDRVFNLDKSYSSGNTYFGCGSYHVPFVTKKDGKILVGFGAFMRFELDEENKKLIPYKHNGVTHRSGEYVCFGLRYSESGVQPSGSGQLDQFLYCEANPDLLLCFIGSTFSNLGSSYQNATIFYEDPCILGEFLYRNGQKNIFYPSNFTYTKYKAGEFDVKDEVAAVNVDSGEAQ